MKTYDQLTPEQQVKALRRSIDTLLRHICEGAIRFNDELNKDDLQARIDSALAKADKMRTPWFAPEYVFDTCKEDIEALAQGEVETSLFSENNENIICGIID